MIKNSRQVLLEDVAAMFEQAGFLWEKLRNSRLFITGGTGFFGCWLLESLLHANRMLSLNVKVVILTRTAAAFRLTHPHLAKDDAVLLHTGDVTSFDFPEGDFTHVIHAASELSLSNQPNPADLVESTIKGCRRVMKLATDRSVTSVLYTSSGAVYGPMTAGRIDLGEDNFLSQLPLSRCGAYGEAKRVGEMVCVLDGEAAGVDVKIARGFAFLGPYLPVDSHLATASFLHSALSGRDIVIRGHGQTVRSFLYGADLAQWLWTILLNGSHARPYNVGSDFPVTIKSLAEYTVAACSSISKVRVLKQLEPGLEPEVYLPDIQRARDELGLEVYTALDKALRRSVLYYQNTNKNEN